LAQRRNISGKDKLISPWSALVIASESGQRSYLMGLATARIGHRKNARSTGWIAGYNGRSLVRFTVAQSHRHARPTRPGLRHRKATGEQKFGDPGRDLPKTVYAISRIAAGKMG
jgi:hypothetical protein